MSEEKKSSRDLAASKACLQETTIVTLLRSMTTTVEDLKALVNQFQLVVEEGSNSVAEETRRHRREISHAMRVMGAASRVNSQLVKLVEKNNVALEALARAYQSETELRRAPIRRVK